jgi:hypothetical protein
MAFETKFDVDGYEPIYNQLSLHMKRVYLNFVLKHRNGVGRPSDNVARDRELHFLHECERELAALNRRIEYRAWSCSETTYERQRDLVALRTHFRFVLGFLFNYEVSKRWT